VRTEPSNDGLQSDDGDVPKPDGAEYRGLSLWHDTVPGSLRPRAALPGDLDVDVAVVGAGFTGLWTAYYLLAEDPSARIAVIDAQIAGFGASGRNGGWCSALFPATASTLAARYGEDAARAHYHAMRGSVREVVRVANAERIDADIALGGTIVLARNAPQLARARAEIVESDRFGLGTTFLGPRAAGERLQATGTLGGTFRPHCATIQPAKLVRGLAECVERRGGRIFEQTPVAAIEAGRVVTSRGVVKADVVVRGTEGYTPAIAGQHRRLAPVYSLVIATAPLPADVWNVIGLAQRETWSDYRHLIVYGQRTADDRMVFGGRGAPYHFGSRIRGSFDRVPQVFSALARSVRELFPVLADVEITHRWGGPLGIARDWQASVGFDRPTGLAWAGGYVGDGVATTNLAGRTLARLIHGGENNLTRLPWVGHRSPSWPVEPMRWLGANAALHAMILADAAEARGIRPSRIASAVDAVLGR
jgi:glycine/D-amino acid oxidase-like deaminating enzyme